MGDGSKKERSFLFPCASFSRLFLRAAGVWLPSNVTFFYHCGCWWHNYYNGLVNFKHVYPVRYLWARQVFVGEL